MKPAFGEMPPDFRAVLCVGQLECETSKIGGEVSDVPQKHGLCCVVAGCFHSLRQVDDDRAGWIKKDVVLGEVSVD